MKQDEETKKVQGNRLREVREYLGLKQAEAARRLGIGTSGLNDVENGRNSLSTTMSRKIAQYLGINPTWVITGEGDKLLTSGEQLKVAMQNNARPIQALRIHYIRTMARITGKSEEEVEMELKAVEEGLP
jgi:transcriptional regulator with XRE-family HTH domain